MQVGRPEKLSIYADQSFHKTEYLYRFMEDSSDLREDYQKVYITSMNLSLTIEISCLLAKGFYFQGLNWDLMRH
jgi:hypothetical protein